ncbi:MFS transporter [Ochrobactrum sp. Q0168]|uniref:MFS transporter n=1 Tax=Ochrobactrum sp. Q0168 TaxID=2793241 RepID=UPI0018EDB838|nr:MFS transporter [Ochrobactrum sp. Q0168]
MSVPPLSSEKPHVELETSFSGAMTMLFAVATGLIVTNLFACQTLVGTLAVSFGFPPAYGSMVAMATLLGYATGLFFLVPLADLTENRALVLRMLSCGAATALIASVTSSGWLFISLLFLLGAACSCIQILVPIAASMAPPEQRGRVIGNVMSGLMVGILLSRPVAGIIADTWGWRSFYQISGAAMVLLICLLWKFLPERRPVGSLPYSALIASLWQLMRNEPVLRSSAFSAAMVMASFSLFWTAVALRLATSPFNLAPNGIAVFALVGAGGAAVTPLVGRLGDLGHGRMIKIISHFLVIVAALLALCAGSSHTVSPWPALLLLGLAAIVLDVGTTGDQTLGRRDINLLRPEARGRLNGVFVGTFFVGGALGSALAGAAWSVGGWELVCFCLAGFGFLALVTDFVRR